MFLLRALAEVAVALFAAGLDPPDVDRFATPPLADLPTGDYERSLRFKKPGSSTNESCMWCRFEPGCAIG